MKLIVGLGNPGKEYENTRHNVGFLAIDKWVMKHSASFDKNKFDGSYTTFYIDSEKVMVLKPLKYMNLSGEVIKKFISYFDIDDILVIHDDKDIELGKFKIRYDGSSAGHNGIKNIIMHLGTEKFNRIRIGLSKNNTELKDFVLGKFSSEEQKIIDEVCDKVSQALDDYFKVSFSDLMNKYNRK